MGIDVGGTNTDAVRIEGGRVTAWKKIPTTPANLLQSIRTALSEVLKRTANQQVERITLSTTLNTNAIIENRTEPVGVLVSAGPGIHPRNYRMDDYYEMIAGSIDHRGNEVKSLNEDQLEFAIDGFKRDNLRVFAVVGKFSTRNPKHENLMAEKLKHVSEFTSAGHRLSGGLNFPRRIATAYHNSAVWRLNHQFVNAIEHSLSELRVTGEVNILKADGGTIPMRLSRGYPVQTIHSGPAASVMGSMAVNRITKDAVILDIGGTTTDAAIFAGGTPLLEREGITIQDRPTLVRAIKTQSIGLGGDSVVRIEENGLKVGPQRAGPALALGGEQPTVMDAFIFLGLVEFGDKKRSVEGFRVFAGKAHRDAGHLAQEVVETAATALKRQVEKMIREVNEKPVYTIHELLYDRPIRPRKIYLMGGPASAFAGVLARRFNMEVKVAAHHSVVNAIGAALARPTFEAELFADTAKRTMLIPNLNVGKVLSPDYSPEKAEQDARHYLIKHLNKLNVPYSEDNVEVTESESFNMVEGFSTIGKNLRVKCQMKPGLTQTIDVNN